MADYQIAAASTLQLPYVRHKCGPFADANGNLYAFFKVLAATNDIACFKSTDGGETWAQVDTAGRPTGSSYGTLSGLAAVQDGDVIHLASYHSSTQAVMYHRINTSDHATPDDWAVIDKLVEAVTNSGTEFGVSIVVQADGDLLILCNGENNRDYSGQEPAITYYSTDNGANWSDDQTLSNRNADTIAGFAVVGASDKIHVCYKPEGDSTIRFAHRSLANVSSTPSAEEALSDYTVTEYPNYGQAPLVFYDDAGDEKIMFVGLNGDPNWYPRSTVITNDGTPAASAQVVATTVFRSSLGLGNPHVAALDLVNWGKKAYCVYADASTQDIWYVLNDDEGGWGAAVEVKDATTCESLTAGVYIRSGHAYLGIIWMITSTYEIRFVAIDLGAVEVGIEGVSSITLDGVTPSLAGEIAIEGTLDKTLDGISPTLTGEIAIEGTLGKTLDGVGTTLTGEIAITGESGITLDGMAGTLEGGLEIQGASTNALENIGAALSGVFKIRGNLDQSLNDTSIEATSGLKVSATLENLLENVIPLITGKLPVKAASSAVLDNLGASLTGEIEIAGMLGIELEGIGATLNGSLDIAGELDKALADTTLSGTGEVYIAGELDKALADMTLSGTGEVYITGELDKALEDTTLSSTGEINITGTVDKILDDLAPVITGEIALTGQAIIILDGTGLEAAGVTGEVPIMGQASIQLDGIGTTLSGEVYLEGSFDQALADFTTISIGGLHIQGITTQALEALTVEASGTVELTGQADLHLGGLTLSAAGNVTISGLLDAALGAVTLSATGTTEGAIESIGSLDVTLAAMGLSAAGLITTGGLVNLSVAVRDLELMVYSRDLAIAIQPRKSLAILTVEDDRL